MRKVSSQSLRLIFGVGANEGYEVTHGIRGYQLYFSSSAQISPQTNMKMSIWLREAQRKTTKALTEFVATGPSSPHSPKCPRSGLPRSCCPSRKMLILSSSSNMINSLLVPIFFLYSLQSNTHILHLSTPLPFP